MPESRDEANKYIVVSDQAATEDSLGFTPYFFPSYFFHVECLKFQFKLNRIEIW